MFTRLILFFVLCSSVGANASEISVPEEASTIQAAIDSASAGDVIVVSPGVYREHLILKRGVTVRSLGSDQIGKQGLKRAELVILQGKGEPNEGPGVLMGEGATLDGITVQGFGTFDQEIWNHHYETQGEELSDGDGAVDVENPRGGIVANAVGCVIRNNLVTRNGSGGIAILGKTDATVPRVTGNIVFENMGGGIGIANESRGVVSANICFKNLRAGIGCRKSMPRIEKNRCFENVRAGIGCRGKAKAVVSDNVCYKNRRAGIGIRMSGTAPTVVRNQCYENRMAGIGCRDGASPTLIENRCTKNAMAGIGGEDSTPVILNNTCSGNEMAGIGLQGCKDIVVQGNVCLDNRLVAIGLVAGTVGIVTGNQFQRNGGMPPIVAIKGDSSITFENNQIHGGGVCALLVEGRATIVRNRFMGREGEQGRGIWIWQDSSVIAHENRLENYRTPVSSTESELVVRRNQFYNFEGVAISMGGCPVGCIVVGNQGFSDDDNSVMLQTTGEKIVEQDNQLVKSPKPSE